MADLTILMWMRYGEARGRSKEKLERVLVLLYSQLPGENTACHATGGHSWEHQRQSWARGIKGSSRRKPFFVVSAGMKGLGRANRLRLDDLKWFQWACSWLSGTWLWGTYGDWIVAKGLRDKQGGNWGSDFIDLTRKGPDSSLAGASKLSQHSTRQISMWP